jgi:serine/threonine-protein kinase
VAPSQPPEALAPPRTLGGRYHLDQLLASGGMGQVWAATDEVLGRRVAVKLLKPELAADARLAARFRREAVAAARLNHPNIVSVFDTVGDHGTEAVVMELVRGRSLRQVLDDQGRLGPMTVRRIGVALTEALDAAHRAGVVHRDLKPGNVLLTPDGRVLLADFGLAKVLDTDDGLSLPRAMVGTAKYLAPEQVEGQPVDGRADLYALGVVLYECLTGRVPFKEATDADTARARLVRPAPPVRSVRPGVPRDLADAVDHLLERDPARRPASAASARDELARVAVTVAPEPPVRLDPSPVPGVEDGDPTPTAPPATGRSWIYATGFVVAVAVCLVTAGVVFAKSDTGTRLLDRVTGRTATPATTVVPTGPPEVTPVPVTAAPGDAVIVSAAEFDPRPAGDGREHPDEIGMLTDRDPATLWRSVCYVQSTMAPKQGVGVLFELSRPAWGQALAVTFPAAGTDVRVYVADRPGEALDGWGEPVATATDVAAGTARFELGQRMGRYVLLLATKAPPSQSCTGRNPYQVRLGEVAITA